MSEQEQEGSISGAVEEAQEALDGGGPVEQDFRKSKHKVKIDDLEEDVDYDELIKNYQKGKSSDKRFQEAARERKDVEDFLLQAQQNPALLFEVLGIDPDEYSSNHLLRKFEEEMLSPEQKQHRDDKAKLAKYQDQEKNYKAAQEAQQRQQQYAQMNENLDQEISSALEESGLKATPRSILRMAEYMLSNITEENSQHLPAKQAIRRVRNDYQTDVIELLGAMDPEQLEAILPKEVLQKLRQHDLRKAQSKFPPTNVSAKPQLQTSGNGTQPAKRKSIDDWLE